MPNSPAAGFETVVAPTLDEIHAAAHRGLWDKAAQEASERRIRELETALESERKESQANRRLLTHWFGKAQQYKNAFDNFQQTVNRIPAE